jgi:hydroxymethylpyrimidine pyrophosphatase-like HAD family hydrolase
MPSRYFRAIALDYDGTLTTNDRPDATVLDAIADARREGRRLILVTGRILAELEQVFPEARESFDAIVAENGAVVWQATRGVRTAALPVSVALEEALRGRGIPVRRGQVLLATAAVYDQAILQEIARLGLGDQLVHNRAALMVLPSGITKGTGLLEALDDLGVSHHSTIGAGDAENDHSLLDVCELGVAVANAVDGLKARADVVLAEPDGAGITSLLRGAILREEVRIPPRRWEVRLGTLPDGRAATVPGAQVNVLITGGTRSGKSCLAGLFAERLMARRYSVCVLDPEGDHLGLGQLHGVMTLGGNEPLPSAELLRRILGHGVGSAVIDLSLRPASEKHDYCRRALEALARAREETGLPHWVFVDEAHLLLGSRNPLLQPEDVQRGLCFVTYRPGELDSATLEAIDVVLTTPGTEALALADAPLPPRLAAQVSRPALERELAGLPLGWAVLFDRAGPRRFVVDRRTSSHIRHWHKYLHASLPPHQRFFFRAPTYATGVAAANLAEFHDALLRSQPDVIRHHAACRDFSRWLGGVIRDDDLARDVRDIERTIEAGADVELLRQQLVGLIEQRYPEEGLDQAPVTWSVRPRSRS